MFRLLPLFLYTIPVDCKLQFSHDCSTVLLMMPFNYSNRAISLIAANVYEYVCHYLLCYYSLESIGLFEVSIDTISLKSIRDLFSTIVPSAVFVAVMALQLKYFSPHVGTEERMRTQLRRSEASRRHRPVSILQIADPPVDDHAAYEPPVVLLEEITEESEAQEEEETVNVNQQDDTDSPNVSAEEARHKHIQEVIEKYWNMAKKIVCILVEIFWRLLELYLPKAIIFVLFAVIIDEISASHFLVLAILVVAIPTEINTVTYLILTAVISNISLLKMLYQVALVDADSFRFSDSCSVCIAII